RSLAVRRRLRRRRLRHVQRAPSRAMGIDVAGRDRATPGGRPAADVGRRPPPDRGDHPRGAGLALGLPGPSRPLPRPPAGHRALDRRASTPGRGGSASRRHFPRSGLMPTAPTTPSAHLTIEAIVAVEAPREFRLHPRDRIVAYTADAAGARQLFTLSLRGGYPHPLT